MFVDKVCGTCTYMFVDKVCGASTYVFVDNLHALGDHDVIIIMPAVSTCQDFFLVQNLSLVNLGGQLQF